jgi:hypothetical protein
MCDRTRLAADAARDATRDAGKRGQGEIAKNLATKGQNRGVPFLQPQTAPDQPPPDLRKKTQ